MRLLVDVRCRLTAPLLTLSLLAAAVSAYAAPRPQRGEDGSVHVVDNAASAKSIETHAASLLRGPTRSVAIVASASADLSEPWFAVPRDLLLASGEFADVTLIDAGQVTPTPLELSAYDAVLVWSNLDFADPSALGDNLADYVDAGGGAVVAVFANSTAEDGRFLTGRWESMGYDVIAPGGTTTTGPASLGTVHVPAHPLMTGVTSFSGGTAGFRPATNSLAHLATLVAEWSDGSTLIAVRENTIGSRVDLGFYPPPDQVPPGSSWDSTTDGGVMLVNALVYAADRAPLIPGDADADNDVDDVDVANFETCFLDPGPVTAGCLTFDFDSSGDIDCLDWVAFLAAWTEGAPLPEFVSCEPCSMDATCDDGIHCNGVERCCIGGILTGGDPCDNEGLCNVGTRPCADLEACCEIAQTCQNACDAGCECDNGVFCDGIEQCVAGQCAPGPPACFGFDACFEVALTCGTCNDPGDCIDGLDCTVAICDTGQCLYDDSACTGACCQPVESCANDTAAAACFASGGEYLGHDTTCDRPTVAKCTGCECACPASPKVVAGIPEGILALDSNGAPAALTANRFLMFTAGSPGISQAIRVTAIDLPPPFDVWIGQSQWVSAPSAVSEIGAVVDPNDAPPGTPTFQAAILECTATPHCMDWSAVGTIHVYGQMIVPSLLASSTGPIDIESLYDVQVIDCECDAANENNFSFSFGATTPGHGDTVQDCAVFPCSPPDEADNIVDVTAVVSSFQSEDTAIVKARADLEPACVDLIINVTDILQAIAGFQGLGYAFAPNNPDACNATCDGLRR